VTTTPVQQESDLYSETGFSPDELKIARKVDANKDTLARNLEEQAKLSATDPRSRAIENQNRGIIEDADKAVRQCPTCVATVSAAAGLALQAGDIGKAMALSDQAVNAAQSNPSDPRATDKIAFALNKRAAVLEKTGEYELAHADAERVLKLKPGDKVALAMLYMTKGRTSAGAVAQAPAGNFPAQTFVRAPIVAPAAVAAPASPSVRAYLDRASTLLGMRDFRGALAEAQRAATLDPANPDPHMQQATAWAALRNMSEAMLAISKAIERLAEGDQRLPGAYTARSLYKNKAGDYVGAVADAGSAIKRDPVFADAYHQRAQAQKVLGNKAESLADAKKAAELNPADYKKFYDLSAREMEEGATPAARQGALGKAWTRLVDAAGGGFKLFAGALGGAFLLAGGVFFLAKEGRTRFSTRASALWTPATAAAGIEGMTFENGRYRAERQIDHGGMGAIHEGRDLKLDRPVALKRMNGELLGDPGHRRRFVKEGETVARLRHPNIVDVYSICDEQGQLVIVFERIQGRNLHDIRLSSVNGRLDPRGIVEILGQIATAIDYAHREGVIHRDLKPSNVMIDEHKRVKVMDFGIARTDHLRTTVTNVSVGTPAYMAPEQADGIVTKQSDVYSLGVIAYEFATGVLPFKGEGMQLDKREGRFTAPSDIMPGLPPAVDLVFKKVLDPNHAQRYASCVEFHQAFESALTHSLT